MIERAEDLVGDGLLIQRARAVVALGQRFPDPRAGAATTPIDPLSAIIYLLLSYRSVPSNAEAAFAELQRRFSRWSELVQAPSADVEEAIRAAGLARQRAVLIQKLIARVVSDYPDCSLARLRTWDDAAILAYLTSLPGVGVLAARQTMLFTLDRPIFPAAWPVVRLLTRLGILDRRLDPEKLLRAVALLLPRGEHRRLYDHLLNQAHEVCAARVPRCRRCHLTDLCAYYRRTRLIHRVEPGRLG